MDASIRLLRILQVVMLFSILLYVLIGEKAGPPQPRALSQSLIGALSMVSAVTVFVIFIVRRVLVYPAFEALEAEPTAPAPLMRWRAGNIATYSLCQTIALYGLVLRMLGLTLEQAGPFYLAGFLLMLFFGPRRPQSLST